MNTNTNGKRLRKVTLFLSAMVILAAIALSGCLQGQGKMAEGGAAKLHTAPAVISQEEWFGAIDIGNIDEVRQLLARGADPGWFNDNGETVLHKAAENGNIELAKLLLALGAQVDIQEREEGYTPLLYAGVRRDREMIKLFLASGADPLAADHEGFTLFHYLAYYKDYEIMLLLAGGESIPENLETTDGLSVAEVKHLGQMKI